jgi:hypothetical protein
MASNNYIYKMSNAGGMSTIQRYTDMLAGNPVFVDAAFESIATVTVGAGGTSTISFTSIPSTYKHLQLRGFLKTNRATFGNDGLYVKVNSNSSNYAQHYLIGDGAAASAAGGGGNTQILIGWTGTNAGSSFAGNVIDILDYADTNKYKTFRNLGGVDLNGTIAGFGGLIALHSGMYYGATTAITQLDFTSSNAATFQEYSSFALYGIK